MVASTVVTDVPLLSAMDSSDRKQYTSVKTPFFTVAVLKEFLLGRALNW